MTFTLEPWYKPCPVGTCNVLSIILLLPAGTKAGYCRKYNVKAHTVNRTQCWRCLKTFHLCDYMYTGAGVLRFLCDYKYTGVGVLQF